MLVHLIYRNRFLLVLVSLIWLNTSTAQSKVRSNASISKIDFKEKLKKSKKKFYRDKNALTKKKLDSSIFNNLLDGNKSKFHENYIDTNFKNLAGQYQNKLADYLQYDGFDFLNSFDQIGEEKRPTLQLTPKFETSETLSDSSYQRALEKWRLDSAKYSEETLSQYSVYQQNWEVDSAVFLSVLEQRIEMDYILEKQKETDLLANFRKETFLEKSEEYFIFEDLGESTQKIITKARKKEERKNFIRELINQKSSTFDSLSPLKRFNGGAMLEPSNNFSNLYFSPFLEYELTSKFLLGMGTEFNFLLKSDFSLIETRGRSYGEYRILRYLVHMETEIISGKPSEGAERKFQKNHLIGVGKNLRFFGKANGKILLLYQLNNNENQKTVLRYGFNIF